MSGILDWKLLRNIELTEEATTSSTRIFLKCLFQDISENWGATTLKKFIEENKEFFINIFPYDSPDNLRFAINFFTAIGLGVVTEHARHTLSSLQNNNNQSRQSRSRSRTR